MVELTISIFNAILGSKFSPVLGSCIVLWVGYRLVFSKEMLTNRRASGKLITNAFQPELDALIQTNEDTRLILTNESFKKHESAIRNNKSGAWGSGLEKSLF